MMFFHLYMKTLSFFLLVDDYWMTNSFGTFKLGCTKSDKMTAPCCVFTLYKQNNLASALTAAHHTLLTSFYQEVIRLCELLPLFRKLFMSSSSSSGAAAARMQLWRTFSHSNKCQRSSSVRVNKCKLLKMLIAWYYNIQMYKILKCYRVYLHTLNLTSLRQRYYSFVC